ncbi:MAG TPA: SBBP repeat-containing protein [Gaiellaceae bacterium]
MFVYAGYIGGAERDDGIKPDGAGGIAVDAAGNAYVAGTTQSTEASFPVTVGPDLTYNHAEDAFVAKVNAAGTAAPAPTMASTSPSTLPVTPTSPASPARARPASR